MYFCAHPPDMSQEPIIKIRQLRELKGFSQEYMAQQMRISQRSYSKLERQETRLDWKRIAEIAAIFDMDPMDLIAFDDNQIFKPETISAVELHQHQLPDKLVEQYEKRIKALEDEIQFLRTQLSK